MKRLLRVFVYHVPTGEVKGFLMDVLTEALKDLQIPKEGIVSVETDWQNFSLNTPVRTKASISASRFFIWALPISTGKTLHRTAGRQPPVDEFNETDYVLRRSASDILSGYKQPGLFESFANGTGRNKAKLIWEPVQFGGHSEDSLENNYGAAGQ